MTCSELDTEEDDWCEFKGGREGSSNIEGVLWMRKERCSSLVLAGGESLRVVVEFMMSSKD